MTSAATGPGLGCGDVPLLCAITRGHRVALAEVYEQYGPGLHNIARGLCGPSRARDLVQDVFLDLWEHPERFDVRQGSLRAQLSMQMCGRCADLLRSETSRQARDGAAGDPGSWPVDGAETIATSRSEHDDIDRALTAIPLREREALVLALHGGHSYREVASILKQPERAIKRQIRAGLSRLHGISVHTPSRPLGLEAGRPRSLPT
jgi:RNA polymerase sigma-70 factor (ECF subfamily)